MTKTNKSRKPIYHTVIVDLESKIGTQAVRFFDTYCLNLLICSIQVFKYKRLFKLDYSYIIMPAAKAFEGYLEKLIKHKHLNVKRKYNIGDVFHADTYKDLSHPVNKQLRDKKYRKIILKINVEWDFCRHKIMHYDEKFRIKDYKEASRKFETILDTIKGSYVAYIGESEPSIKTKRKRTIRTSGNFKREIWVMLGSKNKGKNVEQIEVNEIKYPHEGGKDYKGVDGNTVPTAKEKKICRRTNFESPSSPRVTADDGHIHKNRYIYFRVNRKFIDKNERNFKILIEYFDEEGADWSLEYQSDDLTAKTKGVYKEIFPKEKKNDNKWHKTEFILSDAKFAKGQNGGTDFRVKAKEKDIYIYKVTIEKVKS